MQLLATYLILLTTS